MLREEKDKFKLKRIIKEMEIRAVVVDHQPSIIENVFPAEIVSGLYSSYNFLSQEDLCSFLGKSRFESFKEILNKNVLFLNIKRFEEAVYPVVPLYYYRKLEAIQSESNREALKLHGSSHGVIEGLFHPESKLLWRRISEIADDMVFHDNPQENALSIRNNSIIMTSFSPIEELRATYIRDWSKADLTRRKELLSFEEEDIKELYKKDMPRALYEWPYIVASKSLRLLKKSGLEEKIIEIVRKCDLAASEFELQESQDWVNKEDIRISNLPYLISLLHDSEKIKGGAKTIEEVLNKPRNVKCLQNLSYFHKLKLKEETDTKRQAQRGWMAWKLKNTVDAIIEGDLARASLFYIADFIVTSLIVVMGDIDNWKYEVLIPGKVGHEPEIAKMIAKFKFLLLKVNPTFNYDIEPEKGEKIKAFDMEFVFPRIKARKEMMSEVKEVFEREDDLCKEIEKELEDYGKRIKLEEKVKSIISMSPDLQHILS
jgi:hypothetical protein